MIPGQSPLPTSNRNANAKREHDLNVSNVTGQSNGLPFHRTLHGTVYSPPKVKGKGGSFNYLSYEYSSSYPLKSLIYYTGSTEMYFSRSTETTDRIWIYPGTYIAVRDVPARTTRPITSLLDYIPTYTTTWDTAAYWRIIAPFPEEIVTCTADGTKTMYIAGTEKEPLEGIVSKSVV